MTKVFAGRIFLNTRLSFCSLLLGGLLLTSLFCPQTVEAQLTLEGLLGKKIAADDPAHRDLSDAIVLFQRGNGPAALSLLKTAKQKHPEYPPGEVIFAHLCFASGNSKAGLDVLQLAALEAKEDPEVWNMLADLLLREERLAEADLVFQQAIRVAEAYTGNPERKKRQHANALAGAALANERRSQWQAAEPYLLSWLELAPENPEVYTRLTAVLINTERYDAAFKTLEQLRKIDPRQLPAEVILGNTYDRVGKTEQAKQSLLTALEKYPEDFSTQIAVARWALGAGDFELALKCAGKAKELDSNSVLPDLIVAQTDYLQGNYSAAEEKFQKIYHTNPANYDVANGLALSLLAQNDAQKHKLAQQYAELNAKSHHDLRTALGRQSATLLAWALHRNSASAEADRLMSNVIASGPIASEQAYFAAEIFASQGKISLAKELLTKAIAAPSPFPQKAIATELLKALSEETQKTE